MVHLERVARVLRQAGRVHAGVAAKSSHASTRLMSRAASSWSERKPCASPLSRLALQACPAVPITSRTCG